MRWACILSVCLVAPVSADDWPQWGGPQRDLVWREAGVVETLPTDEEGWLPRKWTTLIGEGYAGPAVADGRVFVTDRIKQKRTERVLCLDAETGRVQWEFEYACNYTISYPAGPRSTPVVDGNRVYTIGAMGDMYCLDVRTGEKLWQKDFVEDFGTTLPAWGMVASPLVDGDRLITLVGGEDALVVAFDKTTGEELWRSLDDPGVGYAPPVIFEFDGVRQLIVWSPEAVAAIQPEDGKPIWRIPFRAKAGLTIATPRRVGNRLFVSAFYNGSRMIEVNGREARVVWQGNSNSEMQTDGLHALMATPWFTGEHVFGVCSYGQLRCLDATTGEREWSTFEATGEGRWWNAFLVPHAPGEKGEVERFYLHNEQGELIVARLTGEGYEELSRAKLVPPTREVRRRQTIWSHPAFAMKSVFARNDAVIVRVDLSGE